MGRGVATEHTTEERRRNAEQRHLDSVRARPPNLWSELEAKLLLHDLMAKASGEQRRLALLRLGGCTLTEAARTQGMSVKRAQRLLKELHSDYLLLHSE